MTITYILQVCTIKFSERESTVQYEYFKVYTNPPKDTKIAYIVSSYFQINHYYRCEIIYFFLSLPLSLSFSLRMHKEIKLMAYNLYNPKIQYI